jgi:hypothetical protein
MTALTPPDGLAAWQRQIWDMLLSEPARPLRLTLHTGRRNGRSYAQRKAIEAAALAGAHIHYLARDGRWGVVWQPAGFLWIKLPDPHRAAPDPQVIYDEPWPAG